MVHFSAEVEAVAAAADIIVPRCQGRQADGSGIAGEWPALGEDINAGNCLESVARGASAVFHG